jgi:ribosomal-protein-alanine N-acetyltransferase
MERDDAFTHLVSFSTERLLLRRMMFEDAEAFFRIKSDPFVTSSYGEEPHHSIEDTRNWVRDCIAAGEKRTALIWTIVLRSSGSAIGMVCLWNFHHVNHCAELGYELHPEHWNQGIMTEVLMPIITYGFTVVGLNRIEASPLVINGPSRSLLRKYGFKEEGTLRQRVFYDGRYLDEMFFALLKEDWGCEGEEIEDEIPR